MESRTVIKNSNRWEGSVYIYKGGHIVEIHRRKIRHVRIDDESVAIIGDNTFRGCTNLQTVECSTMENSDSNNSSSLKEIGNCSFYECRNLSSINLQNTQLETVRYRAFHNCVQLVTVQFPPTVRQIGIGCFQHCRQLKAIDFSHSNYLETIEENAFACCSALKTVILPPSTSCLGKQSFYSCEALEVVDLRATCVKEIRSSTFSFCINLSSLFFPMTAKCIGQDSFRNCKKLSSVDLRTTSVERIGDDAFKYCCNLTAIKFPKTLKFIGRCSFGNCNKLECINLHETSLEKIGDVAFARCGYLKTVIGISSRYQEERGERKETIGDDEMKLPASLIEIGKDAFDRCPKLRKVIDNNWIHYECDVNRGGRRFLQRHHHSHHHHDNDDNGNSDGDAKRIHGKVYYSSLWPLILYRTMNEMKLTRDRICWNDNNLSLYTNAENPLQRRGSVVFYLLKHGVIADLQPSQ